MTKNVFGLRAGVLTLPYRQAMTMVTKRLSVHIPENP